NAFPPPFFRRLRWILTRAPGCPSIASYMTGSAPSSQKGKCGQGSDFPQPEAWPPSSKFHVSRLRTHTTNLSLKASWKHFPEPVLVWRDPYPTTPYSSTRSVRPQSFAERRRTPKAKELPDEYRIAAWHSRSCRRNRG